MVHSAEFNARRRDAYHQARLLGIPSLEAGHIYSELDASRKLPLLLAERTTAPVRARESPAMRRAAADRGERHPFQSFLEDPASWTLLAAGSALASTLRSYSTRWRFRLVAPSRIGCGPSSTGTPRVTEKKWWAFACYPSSRRPTAVSTQDLPTDRTRV